MKLPSESESALGVLAALTACAVIWLWVNSLHVSMGNHLAGELCFAERDVKSSHCKVFEDEFNGNAQLLLTDDSYRKEILALLANDNKRKAEISIAIGEATIEALKQHSKYSDLLQLVPEGTTELNNE